MMKILMVCNYRQGVGGISGQADLLRKHLCDEGHRVGLFNTGGRPWQRLALFLRLWRVARGYDVLHVHCCSHWGFLPAVVGIAVGRGLHRRTVLTYHGGGADAFFGRHPRLVRHYLLRSDCNIVLNGYLKEVFDRHDIPAVVIPNIIEQDTSCYRPRTEFRPHYICTRAHEPLYNIPCILRAFGQVRRRLPDARLTLVGDGSQHRQLMDMAPDGVSFTGRVSNSEIYRQLDRADVLLSSPRSDNMPVSLLEAMNAGLLVISSRVGGVPYMITHGRNGLLFESDDSDQLAALMLQAVEDQAHSRDMTAQAHRDLANYHWDTIRTHIYSAYGLPA